MLVGRSYAHPPEKCVAENSLLPVWSSVFVSVLCRLLPSFLVCFPSFLLRLPFCLLCFLGPWLLICRACRVICAWLSHPTSCFPVLGALALRRVCRLLALFPYLSVYICPLCAYRFFLLFFSNPPSLPFSVLSTSRSVYLPIYRPNSLSCHHSSTKPSIHVRHQIRPSRA